MKVSNGSGTLYIVATPIGNLADISRRAVEVLGSVERIAAEDTRHSARLLQALGIKTPMFALHEHNEESMLERLLERLEQGASLALISDAGTPLISDPGFPLVREARRRGLTVVPIPGPSAVITALSAAGLATDRFLFEGFPPRTASARRHYFQELTRQTATLVFYESSHRLAESLRDMAEVFGPTRRGVVARELTKLHETFLDAPLGELLAMVEADDQQRRGEMVVLVEGAPPRSPEQAEELDVERLLTLLLKELPVKRAAALVAELTGQRKNELYQRALGINGARDD